MPNYPMPLGQCCECDPNPCECEDGVPAGILIALGELASLSVPFEEGTTHYADEVTLPLDYTDTFNYIDRFSEKCTDYQKKLIDSDPFVHGSSVTKWLQWLYIHLVESVTIIYQFDIDPENCQITDMLFRIRFNSEIYSKPGASRGDLCQSPDADSRHSVIHLVLWDFAELDTNCSFFFLPDDPHWIACDWSLERDEVDPEVVGYTFPCTVDGVDENYNDYGEPDYDAEEEQVEYHQHPLLDFTPSDITNWCEVEDGIIVQEALEDSQNYPAGWGKGFIWECEPLEDTDLFGQCSASTDFASFWDGCHLVYTPTLPDYDGTELKVSLYYE